jgi:hypothetical protein
MGIAMQLVMEIMAFKLLISIRVNPDSSNRCPRVCCPSRVQQEVGVRIKTLTPITSLMEDKM